MSLTPYDESELARRDDEDDASLLPWLDLVLSQRGQEDAEGEE